LKWQHRPGGARRDISRARAGASGAHERIKAAPQEPMMKALVKFLKTTLIAQATTVTGCDAGRASASQHARATARSSGEQD
jgi:hypothetical protein